MTARPTAGDRRCLPVNEVGTVLASNRSEADIAMWTCERFDGRLWLMEGIAGSARERDGYLDERTT